MDERLRQVRLFAELTDDDLVRICQGVEDRALTPGEVLFSEGERGDTAYVVVSGQVEIIKAMGRRETLLAMRGPGDVIGEMALLQEAPRIASVRARIATDLLTIPKSVLDGLLATSPSAVRSVFRTLLDRLRETNDRQRQTERMAQLGTLTAGVAHELNNPAAGARRAAERLGEALDELAGTIGTAADLDQATRARVVEYAVTERTATLDAVARGDEEAAVENWLQDHDVAEAWRLAPDLVDAGFGIPDIENLTKNLAPGRTSATVHLLVRLAVPRRLAREIATGTQRVSEIVSRLKSHAYLDRAPVQDVHVHEELENTLLLLAHKLRNIRVVREYGADVPPITAVGGELNQVWTNLLDNAGYELTRSGVADPVLTIRTRRDTDDVIVEVEDNGPGIPVDIRDRIFDAFFTTKPPGAGTGQGLNLSFQIVVLDHHGELTAESEPGRTTFRVALPIEPPGPAVEEQRRGHAGGT